MTTTLALGLLLAVQDSADPFPLVAETSYVYKGTFKDREYQDAFVLKSLKRGEAEFFYLEKAASDSPLIGNPLMGLGAFRRRGDVLLTYKATVKRELTAFDPEGGQGLLRFPLKEGDARAVETPDKQRRITTKVAGREEVVVPAGTFKDCFRIEIEDAWPERGKTYPGTIWLACGVGAVKWIRSTGRVDELVSFAFPKR